MPLEVFVIMASSEDSTIDAKRNILSSKSSSEKLESFSVSVIDELLLF